jgi:hypothetical protein
MDVGADQTNDITSWGPYPPSLGLLVPLWRDPFTDGHFAVRGEFTLPVGSSSSFRGDDAVTERATAVYGGPVGNTFAVLSVGGMLSPALTTSTGPVGGGTILTGLAFRIPREAPLACVVSAQGQFDTGGGNDMVGLGSLGLQFRTGSGTAQLLVGAQAHFDGTVPNAWFGIGWVERASAFPDTTPSGGPIGQATLPSSRLAMPAVSGR